MEDKTTKSKKLKIAQLNLINPGKITSLMCSKKISNKKFEKIKHNAIKTISISLDSPEITPKKQTNNTINLDLQIPNIKKKKKFLKSNTHCYNQHEKKNKVNKIKNSNNFNKEIKNLKINDNKVFLSSLNNIYDTKKSSSENNLVKVEDKPEDITDYIDMTENQYNKEYNNYKEIRNEAIEEVEEAKETSEFRYTSSSFHKANSTNKIIKRSDINKNKTRINKSNNIKKNEKHEKHENKYENTPNEANFFFKKKINSRTQVRHKSKEKLNIKVNNTFDDIDNKVIIINNNIININSINDNRVSLNRDILHKLCKNEEQNLFNKKIDKIIFKKENNHIQKSENLTNYNKSILNLKINDDCNSQMQLRKKINPKKNIVAKNYKSFIESRKISKLLTFSNTNSRLNSIIEKSICPSVNNYHNIFSNLNIFDSNNSSINSNSNTINNITDKKIIINSNSYKKTNFIQSQKNYKHKHKFKKTFKKLLLGNEEFNESKYQKLIGHIHNIGSCTSIIKSSKSHVKIKKNALFESRLKNPFSSKLQSSFVSYPNKLMKSLNILKSKNTSKNKKNNEKMKTIGQYSMKIIHNKQSERSKRIKKFK